MVMLVWEVGGDHGAGVDGSADTPPPRRCSPFGRAVLSSHPPEALSESAERPKRALTRLTHLSRKKKAQQAPHNHEHMQVRTKPTASQAIVAPPRARGGLGAGVGLSALSSTRAFRESVFSSSTAMTGTSDKDDTDAGPSLS
mmetsp:Transcript_39125/g.71932  ORF Transcript_39125/g.71932 Transcript_39125/m.71932 type:complete len:142 (-) Transcript_39125:487-912(-)